MNTHTHKWLTLTTAICLIAATPAFAQKKPSSRAKKRGTNGGAPGADPKSLIIWGSECKQPEGKGLAFGGQHQKAEDGRPHTRLLVSNNWVAVHAELRKNNPLQKQHDQLWSLRTELKNAIARARYIYFQGKTEAEERAFLEKDVNPALAKVAQGLQPLVKILRPPAGKYTYVGGQAAFAGKHLRAAQPAVKPFAGRTEPDILAALRKAQIELEIASEALDAEPPPRVCSKVVYDAKSKLYVVFGGDHYEYLTNDTWVFDSAKKKWFQRHPVTAPEPRANHELEAKGDGTVTLQGGYIYLGTFNYGSRPYCYVGQAEWVYDVQANKWSSSSTEEKALPSDSRTYRTAKYLPEFYLQGHRPDATAHEAKLEAIPVNTWVNMTPKMRPQKLQMNRGWGTSVLDNDHDLILQWGGGHSAAGGTDVLHYHIATGRWEQPYPIEYCLGQVGSTSVYPCGYNFNRHPWMIMHAYKSYAYETKLKQMVLTGRNINWGYSHDTSFYLYDPMIGDWTTRHPLHKKMLGVQYYLKSRVIASPHGILFWGPGRAFHLDTSALKWNPYKVEGKLPTAGTDGGGLVYDSKRDRMLMVSKPWASQAKGVFNGKVYALDLKTKTVSVLEPKGTERVTYLFLREAAYNPEADIFIWAAQKGGKTIAYDPKANAWVALKIGGKAVFSFSSGHFYDSKRRLHWVADGGGGVFCMRLDMKSVEKE